MTEPAEWKAFLALYVTLVGWRFVREMGRMYWWEREGWWMLPSRAFVVLALWAGLHLWKWAVSA